MEGWEGHRIMGTKLPQFVASRYHSSTWVVSFAAGLMLYLLVLGVLSGFSLTLSGVSCPRRSVVLGLLGLQLLQPYGARYNGDTSDWWE